VSYEHAGQRVEWDKVRGSHLVLFEPFFEELFPTLLQDWARELHRLEMIEFPFLQEDAEILENRRKTSGRSRRLLERLDDLRGAQDTLSIKHEQVLLWQELNAETNPWRVRCNLGRLVVLAALKQRLVLLYVKVVCTRQVTTTCKLECELRVIQCL
jgi:broad specificity phosphatase PhoE